MLDVSEFIIIWSFVNILAMMVLIGLLYHAIVCQIDKRVTEMEQRQFNDMEKHQEWLFNQLYAIKPGAVLRPEETEEKIESKPAFVYSPTEDPMSEFTGLKEDWR